MGNLFGSPKADTSASDLEEEKREAKKSRVSLFKTLGGVQGEEVQQVGQRRDTLLGN